MYLSIQQVAEFTRRIQESESRVHQLLEAAEVRDATMMKLEAKARLFYEVVEHTSRHWPDYCKFWRS